MKLIEPRHHQTKTNFFLFLKELNREEWIRMVGGRFNDDVGWFFFFFSALYASESFLSFIWGGVESRDSSSFS